MSPRFLLPLGIALLGYTALVPAAASAQTSCAGLASLNLPEVTKIASQSVPAGTFAPPDGSAPVTGLPTFCRVSITVLPSINIEVWLPDSASWNRRYEGEGGGGYAGSISWSALGTALTLGFATASTDTGHSNSNPAQTGGTFALTPDDVLNVKLINDFASRSLHELALKAKQVILAYYGVPPEYSYWLGCSTGGRQGLIEAQRYPADYDGIVAGAPAINWDRFIPAELWPEVAMNLEVGAPIAASKLNAATNAAIASCDAIDGVTDGVIDNPQRCTFDPVVLQCDSAGAPTDGTCLTPQEVSAVRKIWDGPRVTDLSGNPTGRRLWYGLERGASLTSLAGSTPFSISVQHFQYWIQQNPNFDWHTLTYASYVSNFIASELKFHDVIGSDNPDLSQFRSRGGKLIIYHGWADQLIFPLGTVNYFERVQNTLGGNVNDFARLFMAPGVGHCGGGPGPNAFVRGAAPVPADPTHDLSLAMINWVENGLAPASVIATKYVGDNPANGVLRTRPLCVFPAEARWTGNGSTDNAANFACVTPGDVPAIYNTDPVLPDYGDQSGSAQALSHP